MQTPDTSPAAIDALLNRATTGMLFDISEANRIRPTFDFWQAYAKALRDLQRGVGQKLAEKDERLGGYAAPRYLRTAAGVLGVDLYRLSRVEIEQRLAQAGIKVPFDALPGGDIEATKQLEDGAVSAIDLDEKHSVARVDSYDGAGLHGVPPVAGADIVADGANTKGAAHINYTAAVDGKAQAVCICCNQHSPPARVDSEGEPDLFDLPRDWSQAPLPPSYQHKDGSRGSTYTCPDCNARLGQGETLTRRAGESASTKAVAA